MKNIFDLTGKTALVTGASSGLGIQFAKALANQGADIAITARRTERLEQVKKEIEEMGIKCFMVTCDVGKTDEIISMAAKVKEHFGKIDILVNNAGVGYPVSADTQTDEEWRLIIDINLNSVYFMAREVGKIMIGQKYGKIINIGSLHSTVCFAGSPISAYCASKGGVEMLTKALANEWASYNITVNAIGPAYFPSEMTDSVIKDEQFLNAVKVYCPMGRVGRDGELDGAIVYFASDASSYTTGQLLTVDGGWTTI
jgi:gluconate 5-dehydrogenase